MSPKKVTLHRQGLLLVAFIPLVEFVIIGVEDVFIIGVEVSGVVVLLCRIDASNINWIRIFRKVGDEIFEP